MEKVGTFDASPYQMTVWTPNFEELGAGRRGAVENDAGRNVYSTFLFDFGSHDIHILHRLATMQNATDRQKTERTIGISRLCTSIDCQKPQFSFYINSIFVYKS